MVFRKNFLWGGVTANQLEGPFDEDERGLVNVDLSSVMKNGNYEIATWWVCTLLLFNKAIEPEREITKKIEEILEIKSEGIEEVKNSEFKIEWIKYEKREEIREIKRQIKHLKAE